MNHIIISIREEKKPCDYPIQRIEFDGIEYYICFSEKLKSSLNKDLSYLALFALNGKETNRFYYDEKRSSLYLIKKYSEKVEIKIISVEKDIEENAIENMVDEYFGGIDSTEAILESPKELRNIYGKKYLKSILLIFLLLAIIAAMFYLFFKDEMKQKAKKPYYPPLSQVERTYLLNKVSKQTIKILNDEIHTYESSIDKIKRTRIVGFTLNRIDIIPPVEPIYDEKKNIWYYAGEKFPKRGGFIAIIEIQLEQTFAGIGFTIKEHTDENTVYGKTITKTITYDERDMASNYNQNLVLTRECLNETLNLTKNTIPTKREDRSIEFVIDNTSGITIISELKKTIEHCPLTIKSIMLSSTDFRIEAILRNDIEK